MNIQTVIQTIDSYNRILCSLLTNETVEVIALISLISWRLPLAKSVIWKCDVSVAIPRLCYRYRAVKHWNTAATQSAHCRFVPLQWIPGPVPACSI